jgi:hypothetical protein
LQCFWYQKNSVFEKVIRKKAIQIELLKPCRSQREASKNFRNLAALSEKPSEKSEALPLSV